MQNSCDSVFQIKISNNYFSTCFNWNQISKDTKPPNLLLHYGLKRHKLSESFVIETFETPVKMLNPVISIFL